MPEKNDEIAIEIMTTLLRVINKMQQTSRVPRDYGNAGRMTMLEAQMCFRISQEDGITGSELSAELGVTRSATSQTITKLKDKGLVVEQIDPDDAKRKRLYVTKRGQSAAGVAKGYLHLMSGELFDESRAELKAYLRFVTRLEDFHKEFRGGLIERAASNG